MKVSEIPYKRYTIEEAKEAFASVRTKLQNAASCREALAARDEFLSMMTTYATAASLSHCRFTLNTKAPFYQAEVAYYDEVGPLFGELNVQYSDLMLASPFRAEMEAQIGSRTFRMYEIAKKTFSPAIVEDLQKENAITTEYSKFMSEMLFTFDGEKMPLSVLRGKLEDADRDVRRRTAEAIGRGLEENADRLDDIYDRLVKIRDGIAKKLGYKNFVELGYYRMNRLDYDADMIRHFRENVARDLVPAVSRVKAELAAELGITDFKFYDDAVSAAGATVRPHLSVDEIFAAAREMYHDMNPEIGRFMDEMCEAGAFDVMPREGKWGGGYCTSFPAYKQPFILANFNGSCGDIDVITHEFGHALAANFVFHGGDMELDVGGMETAECHSMSMEFLCWKYMDKFFGDEADKYRRKHLLSALSFIPYGVIVDEFQQNVYEHPEYTPAERKKMYLELEKKYRPYLSFDGIPYLEEGTRWQYQMHIYESPFYYIDYCLAQTVALSFLFASREDYSSALSRYLDFARAGGTRAFPDLIAAAGLPSPFVDGSLKAMAEKAIRLAEELSEKKS